MNELIIGRRGLGKSTLARTEARKLNRNQIFFDPGDQFHNVDKKVSDVDALEKQLERLDEENGPRSISYVPVAHTNVENAWNQFAAKLWEFTGQHEDAASYALVVDESHRLQSPQYINDWLDEFIRRAPRRERGDRNPVDIIQTTHYPQDLNRVSWGESDEIFFFNVMHKRAKKAITDQFGDDVTAEVEVLRTPQTGGRDVLSVTSETGEYRVMDNPEEWRSDIRTPNAPRETDKLISKHLEEIYGRL